MEGKRSRVITLYNEGFKAWEIVKQLGELKVNRKFVYRCVKWYKETGLTVKPETRGRPTTATTPAIVQRVRCRIQRNPRQSARKLAKSLKISDRSIRRILTKKLKKKPLKIRKVHDLDERKKKVRLQRSRLLKKRLAASKDTEIVFSDEKLFTVEQVLNSQNDRVWANSRSSIDLDNFHATRTQNPASVMVWCGISPSGRTPLVFLPAGVKMNAQMYQDLILKETLKPWADAHYANKPWIFQQDSAPSHTAKTTQKWLQENLPSFISPEEWPPYSPDLNPLDFCIWSILESDVCSTRQPSIDVLKERLKEAWQKIPQEVLRAACENFKKRIQLVVQARGGHIEN